MVDENELYPNASSRSAQYRPQSSGSDIIGGRSGASGLKRKRHLQASGEPTVSKRQRESSPEFYIVASNARDNSEEPLFLQVSSSSKAALYTAAPTEMLADPSFWLRVIAKRVLEVCRDRISPEPELLVQGFIQELLSRVEPEDRNTYYSSQWYQYPMHTYMLSELAFDSPRVWLTCASLLADFDASRQFDRPGFREARRLYRFVNALQSGESPIPDQSYNTVSILADYYGCQERCLTLLKEKKLPPDFDSNMLLAMLHDDVLSACAQLQLVLQDETLYKDLLNRTDQEARLLLNLMHELLDFPGIPARMQSDCIKALMRLSACTRLHPDCLVLRDLEKIGDDPVAAGAFGEVWKGIIHGQQVSVKIVKVYSRHDVDTLLKAFYHEAILWSQLRHPNILPLYGIYYHNVERTRICLVSPWQENGNIMQYLAKTRNADPFLLLFDIAQGVDYLHRKKIVHGDLKGVNILVTPSGRACIMDFGLSTIADSQMLKWNSLSSSAVHGGTARWQAPEILKGGCNSFKGDVYAFACVCYEVFAQSHPFPEFPQEATVIFKVMSGVRPSRPNSVQLSNDMWDLIQDCWNAEPQDRPLAAEVAERIRKLPELANKELASNRWDESFPKNLRTRLRPRPLIPSEQVLQTIFPDNCGCPGSSAYDQSVSSNALASGEKAFVRRVPAKAQSCRECRRLKLKCDRVIPCSSCKLRGCASICPNGSLVNGDGTHFVLSDSEKLHQKISRMSDRISQLEDALLISQEMMTSEPHPLLDKELLKIKSSVEL